MSELVEDVEVQAILALCHHQEGPLRPGCPQCAFRAEAAVEHLQVTIKAVVESIDGCRG